MKKIIVICLQPFCVNILLDCKYILMFFIVF